MIELSFNRNNWNFKGRNNLRDDKNRGKYDKDGRRNLKDRDRSYER